MLHSSEDQKHAVIEQAAGLASAHAAAISSDARAIRRFVQAFYEHVAPDDVVPRAASDLSDAALSLWRFAAERQVGQPKLRVLSPSGTEETWLDGHSIVQIVNDDMPFLVDSVTAALTGLGLEVQLVIHPVLSVQRDGTGRLTNCGPDIAGGVDESLMHVELAGDADNERRPAIIDRLTGVLADVRAVVSDLPTMRQLVKQIADEAEHVQQAAAAPEASEAAAFLNWLDDGNFLFFGYREYTLGESGLGVVPGSGKGLLSSDDYLVFDGLRALTQIPPDLQAFLRSPQLTMTAKATRRSPVHRAAPMDTILVKKFDAAGEVTGLRLLLGLFTAEFLSSPAERDSAAAAESPPLPGALRLRSRSARRQGAPTRPGYVPAGRAVSDRRNTVIGDSARHPAFATAPARGAVCFA